MCHQGCGASPDRGETEADAVSKDKAWKQVRTEWRDVVLVCRKCSKRLDGGFGPDGGQVLAKALRKSLATLAGGAFGKVKARRRDIAVIEVGCLDICPKKAVVMVKCSEPNIMFLVPKGAEMDDVLDRLRLPMGPRMQLLRESRPLGLVKRLGEPPKS